MDSNIFVDFCVIEFLPAFVAEAEISHLSQTSAFVRVYRADRKTQGDDLACVCPSLRHSGILWKLPSRGCSSGAAAEPDDLGVITAGPSSAAAPASKLKQ